MTGKILPPGSDTDDALAALRRGLDHHRAGRLAEAIETYAGLLGGDPSCADAWHLMGMALHGAGRGKAALACLARAIGLRPEIAAFHNNLGHVLHCLGRREQALLCFEQALAVDPGHVEALVNLGNALQDLRRPADAAACYRRALEMKPESPEALNNLGNALVTLGEAQHALSCFELALRLRPGYAEAHVNRGTALQSLRRFKEAAASCREALRHAPKMAEAHGNLGAALLKLGALDEAAACCREALRLRPRLVEPRVVLSAVVERQGRYREAEEHSRQVLRIRPGHPEALNNLGNALQQQGRIEEAIALYGEALRHDPSLPDAHYNLGNALRERCRLTEARSCYERAIELDPTHAKAHWNLSLTLLLAGDFRRGWEEFEWRWKKPDTPARDFPKPMWDGSPVEGKTVYLHAEQGMGDTLQFVRYAPLVRARGARVIAEVHPPLVGLLEGCGGIDRVVPAGSELPPFDVHLPLLSLPRVLGAVGIPAAVPYIAPGEAFRAKWRGRLSGIRRFKAGLVWAGNPRHSDDRRRSLPPGALAPLAAVDGVRWYSLQFGLRAGQSPAPPEGFPLTDLGPETQDFRDLAAAIEEMDLVISVDTSAAHLAGALGLPVWVLLPYLPDWRWGLGRPDTPWYPTMRLFRQRRPGEWASVIEDAARQLRRAAKPGALTSPDRADMSSDG